MDCDRQSPVERGCLARLADEVDAVLGDRVARAPGPGSNSAIASILVISERAVEKHVGNIFSKLGLAPSDADHRRVLAVLRYLESWLTPFMRNRSMMRTLACSADTGTRSLTPWNIA